MSEISATSIGTMRYAPSGSSAIELYNFNGAEDLTLSQLVIALCVRASAVFERDSIVQLNMMNRGVENIEELATWGDQVLANSLTDKEWTSIRKALIDKYGVSEKSLPAQLDTYDNRMTAMDQIEQCLTDENSSVDRISIEIETAINRRDTQYQLATETVTHCGSSGMNTANTLGPAGK